MLLRCISLVLAITAVALIFHRIRFAEAYRVKGCKRVMKLDDCKTGDVILFSGRGRDSATVKAWSASPWSHVGLAYREAQRGQLYLWHADAISYRKDVRNGKHEEGAQLNDMEAVLRTYPGHIYVLPLSKPCDQERFEAVCRAVKGVRFNHDLIELLFCTFGVSPWETDPSTMFCSELVALTLAYCGVIGDRYPFSSYHPSSFIGALKCDWKGDYEPDLRNLARLKL